MIPLDETNIISHDSHIPYDETNMISHYSHGTRKMETVIEVNHHIEVKDSN